METIRAARQEDAWGMAHVSVDSWRTTYTGIVPADYLDQLSLSSRAQGWLAIVEARQSFTFVAENEQGKIVGLVSGGPGRGEDAYQGELYAIYLLQDYQGMGLGTRLIKILAEHLLKAGIQSMFLWALTENPACRFYEALGGQPFKTQQIEIGGADLQEVAYGWSDLSRLFVR
ncbi:GNAT family N-acetyltransferase [Tengunoibacter tsumagoiensis]|nr:GNAT family N-acetyltransferase [Tengunoibacter tsumagoiensis]